MGAGDKLIYDLSAIGAIRLGPVPVSGHPPVTIDLRPLVAHPHVLRRAAHTLAEIIEGLEFDRIAVMSSTLLPLGTAIALELTRPLIYSVTEPEPGQPPTIEGLYSRGEKVLLISGVLRGGEAKLDLIHRLEAVGLRVTDIAVLIDREEGGMAILEQQGYHAHAALTLTELIDALRRRKATAPQPAVGPGD